MPSGATRRFSWQRPEFLLLLMSAAVPLSFATWQALINNFAIERVAFSGVEIGILQSLREIPGFLALGVVLILWLIREQTLALVALGLLGLGTALTGFFPSAIGLYLTTVLMSVGFHYFETVRISLSLQWIDKQRTPLVLGRVIAVGAFAGIVSYAMVWAAFEWFALDFRGTYLLGGGLTLVIALVAWLAFPHFPQAVPQHKHLVLRRRYWLYYLLTFLSGARRQIFMVFAGFLLVEKFAYDVRGIAVLFLINGVLNMLLAPQIGRLVARWGERRALVFEYAGLVVVFSAYALVESAVVAAGLYIVDHVFFALSIAIKTYFQKIADPADIASTAGVGFTINHIAAVAIPAAFGALWLVSPAAVFFAGAGMAALSVLCALNVPRHPEPGREVVWQPAAASILASPSRGEGS